MTGLPLYLALALAVSLGGNALLVHEYLSERDAAAAARVTADSNLALANQCSDGVQSLKAAADARAAQAEGARDAALKLAQAAQARGLQLVAKPPAVPGNDCASAKAQVDDWLSSRKPK